MADNLFINLDLLIRWTHVIAGITWIGLLYFFNFVNIQLQGSLDDAGKKAVNPQLMPRALWWFRWGAMITFLSGLILFIMVYMHGKILTDPDGVAGIGARAWWIMVLGMLPGTIMWFNVWFIIWPAQQKLLGGTAGDDAPTLRSRASKASRVNTYLSGPMLFGMLGAPHLGVYEMHIAVIAAALGLIAIKFAYTGSPNAGQSLLPKTESED